MAVKPNSKGVVTGTKNADKITFGTSSEWQKALTVNAGAGADTIDFKKSKYKNTLNGEAGNDTIYGGTVADMIRGGAGADKIHGYNGKDELYGDAGKDTIYGGNGDDYLNGGADNDKLYGDAGTDTIMGGDGNDSLYGGDGIDSVVGGNGDDYIEGGAGFGRLFGLTGNDTIKGGKDKDTIDGGDDKDVLYGGGDSDTIKGNKGNDILYGEDGNDYLYGMNDNDTLYGGAGNDLLDGGPGNDSLIGGDGNDTVRAGADNDYVDSGNGDDFIQGHGGKDTLKGGNGNDTIEGNDGDDLIYGDSGNDLLRGGNGNDTITAGKGNDTINAGTGKNTIIFNKNEGTNTILNGGGTDTLLLNGGIDFRALSFAYDGNDLKISAEGTTAILKNQKTGGSSIKYIKSGNETIKLPQDIIITNENTDFSQSHDNLFVYSEGAGAYTGFGNDTVFASQSRVTSVLTFGGDDIIIGSDYPSVGGHLYYGGDGNDTIYVGKSGANVVMQRGNDVIYTPDTDNIDIVSNYLFNENFGNATIYWRGNTVNYLVFNNGTVSYDNITFFRNPENNDLLFSAPGNNRITIKDYFKAGNEAMASSLLFRTGSNTLSFGTLVSEKGISNFTYGTDGNDSFNITNNFNYILTKSGNDTINVNNADLNTIEAGAGNDSIYLTGTDSIYVDSGDGNDIISDNSENKSTYTIINAGNGDDVISIHGGNAIITGGKGYDEIHVESGCTIYGGEDSIGTDDNCNSIEAINGAYYTVFAGNGIQKDNYRQGDTITVGNYLYNYYGSAVIYGGLGNDSIDANRTELSTIYGGGGDDTIIAASYGGVTNGGDGNDSITTFAGNNTINGGEGNDIIISGESNDIINAGYGNNTINGEEGNDSIYAGYGNNTINGGEGTDYIDVTKGVNTIIFENIPTVYSGNDSLIETVVGFKNTDTLQITTVSEYGMAPMRIDSQNKDLYLGVNGTGTSNIKIANYSEETSNGWIKINDADAVRMSDFLAANNMYLYDDEANILSNLTSGTYYTFGGNDVLTNMGSSDIWCGTYVYAGTGNDSITNINDGHVYVYGEDGNDTITTGTFAIYNGFLHGGDGDDVITANDENVVTNIYGDDGDDIITGGRYMIGGDGNDTIISIYGAQDYATNVVTIEPGTGNDEIHVLDTNNQTVYYRFNNNQIEGNDVIYDGLTGDRFLHFDGISLNSIVYARYGNDLIIKYQDQNSNEYRNSITVKNFITSENQNRLKYDNGTSAGVTVKSYIDAHGYDEEIDTVANYTVNNSNYNSENPLVLSQIENNNVLFSDTFTACYITSENVSGYTDTLQISDVDIRTAENLEKTDFTAGSLHLNAQWKDNTNTKGGDIYYSYSTESTPDIVVTDSQTSYKFSGYTDTIGTSDESFVLSDGNNMTFISASEGTSYVTSNDDNNIIYTSGGAALNYSYGGGNDVVFSSILIDESTSTTTVSNDTYNVTVSRENSVRINDYGGTADVLNITIDNPDDLRIFLDIGKYNYYDKRVAIVHKDDFTLENLLKFSDGYSDVGIYCTAWGGDTYYHSQGEGKGIENISINGTVIDKATWYNEIKEAVTGWFDECFAGTIHQYDGASDAIYAYKNNLYEVDLSGLVNAYKSVKYSDVYGT